MFNARTFSAFLQQTRSKHSGLELPKNELEKITLALNNYQDHQCSHINVYPGTNRAMRAAIKLARDIPVIIAF